MPNMVFMRRIVSIAPVVGFTAWDKGWDFRNTVGFVTDLAPNTSFVGNNSTATPEPYPTTANGATFGTSSAFSSTDNARDRNSSVDVRLAGFLFQGNTGSKATLRFDLPVTGGTYTVSLALGDANNTLDNTKAVILDGDGTTVLKTISTAATGSGNFLDATGAVLSTANWPGSQATTSISPTGNHIFVVLGMDTNTGDNTKIAHFRLTRTA